MLACSLNSRRDRALAASTAASCSRTAERLLVGLGLAVGRGLEDADVRQSAELLVEVHAVADDELVLNGEAIKVDVDGGETAFLLVEQRAQLQRRGLLALHVLEDPRKRGSGVDEVLDDEHVGALDAHVQVLLHDDVARRVGVSVRRNADEVDHGRHSELADQVSHEQDRALEEADSDDTLALVVSRDLL